MQSDSISFLIVAVYNSIVESVNYCRYVYRMHKYVSLFLRFYMCICV
jgi:hypothetical protein